MTKKSKRNARQRSINNANTRKPYLSNLVLGLFLLLIGAIGLYSEQSAVCIFCSKHGREWQQLKFFLVSLIVSGFGVSLIGYSVYQWLQSLNREQSTKPHTPQ